MSISKSSRSLPCILFAGAWIVIEPSHTSRERPTASRRLLVDCSEPAMENPGKIQEKHNWALQDSPRFPKFSGMRQHVNAFSANLCQIVEESGRTDGNRSHFPAVEIAHSDQMIVRVGEENPASGHAQTAWLPKLRRAPSPVRRSPTIAAEDGFDLTRFRVEPLDLVVVAIGDIDGRHAILDDSIDAKWVLQAHAIATGVDIAKVEESPSDQ